MREMKASTKHIPATTIYLSSGQYGRKQRLFDSNRQPPRLRQANQPYTPHTKDLIFGVLKDTAFSALPFMSRQYSLKCVLKKPRIHTHYRLKRFRITNKIIAIWRTQ